MKLRTCTYSNLLCVSVVYQTPRQVLCRVRKLEGMPSRISEVPPPTQHETPPRGTGRPGTIEASHEETCSCRQDSRELSDQRPS